MEKCLQCGAPLPAQGDCPKCHASRRAVRSSILDKDLNLDRRARRAPQPYEGPTVVGKLPTRAEKPTSPGAQNPFQQIDVSTQPTYSRRSRVDEQLVDDPPTDPGLLRDAEEDLAGAQDLLSEPERPGDTSMLPPVEADPNDVEDPTSPRGELPAAHEIHARPAALWRRVIAFAIDLTLVGGVVALYLFAASALVGGKHKSAATGLEGAVANAHAMEKVLLPGVVLAVVIALVYTAWFGFAWRGRTPGRRVAGIQLVDRSGQAPTPLRSIVRAVLAGLSVGFALGGLWLALFDRRGQTLHDKLTGTFVVKPS